VQTLHNRINELGVAEPVIQQQGADRVVVELPGVQDTAKAKEILGRTATLEGPPARARVVVIEFPSFDRAKQFYDSSEYVAARKVRAGAAWRS